MGALVMHQSRCIAKGGFKIINGSSKMGKGPMSNEKEQDTSTETSLPQPTHAGRTKPCAESINKAMKCLENNDKQCVMKKIEELIRNQCHDSNAVGKVITDGVREIVRTLWLESVGDYEKRCELLKILRDLGLSKRWTRDALRIGTDYLNRWLAKCGVDWEGGVMRNVAVKAIEDLLRKSFGWSETKMCEEMFKFIGINVNDFRKYGIEPCNWLNGLELLSDLRRPYWLGLARSDLIVKVDKKDNNHGYHTLELGTTNTIDAIFFAEILSAFKTPGLAIVWREKIPTMRHVDEPIELLYYVALGVDDWPWPIKLSADELERILNNFNDEELAEFIAALLDGDGTVRYATTVYVVFAACKNCLKRVILDVLKNIIIERFGIVGNIDLRKTANVLEFRDGDAVKLLRHVVKYMHHPLRRLRTELILAYYNSKLSYDEFMRLYEMTKYKYERPDIKRNHGLEALAQAAPQTHTHGVIFHAIT
jgi:hypothetical protein